MDGNAGEVKRKKQRKKDQQTTLDGKNLGCLDECFDEYGENVQQEQISLSATVSQPGMYTITTNSTLSFSIPKFSTVASLLHIA